jgi:hypothetical protein
MSDAKRAFFLFLCAAPLHAQFHVDTSRAPDLKPWSDRAIVTWQQAYPVICDALASPGFTPPTLIKITIDPNSEGAADYSASGVTLYAKFVRSRPDEAVAAIIHETAHVVQSYTTPGIPMWLVDGIADYVRFFRWRTGELGHINPDRAHYYGSYRITASFLNYLADHYDPDIVRKLNQACREGHYRESIFQELTGKPVAVLGKEWHATLPRTPADFGPHAESDIEEEPFFTIRSILITAAISGAIGLVLAAFLRRRVG